MHTDELQRRFEIIREDKHHERKENQSDLSTRRRVEPAAKRWHTVLVPAIEELLFAASEREY